MMQRVILLSILSVTSFVATAQEVQHVDPLNVSSGDRQFSPPVNADQLRAGVWGAFEEIRGQYDMANGKTLTLSTSNHKIYAELDGMPKQELVAAAPNIFVAKNRQMKMTFHQFPNGNVDGVELSYFAPDEKGAIAIVELGRIDYPR